MVALILMTLAISWGCTQAPDETGMSESTVTESARRGSDQEAAARTPAGRLEDGSFEAIEAGGHDLGAWHSNEILTIAFPTPACSAEVGIGFPSDGRKWLRIDGGWKAIYWEPLRKYLA